MQLDTLSVQDLRAHLCTEINSSLYYTIQNWITLNSLFVAVNETLRASVLVESGFTS